MDFFKTFIYLFGRNFRKLVISILFILFLTLSFFLILTTSNSVSAETTIDVNSQKLLDYYNSNLKSSFSDVIILDGWMICFNNTPNNTFWIWQINSNKNWLQCTNQANISTNMYILNGDNVSLYSTTLKFGSSSGCYDIGSSNINVTSVDIYSGYYNSPNTNSLLYPNNYNDFVFIPPALYPNANIDQTPLTSGNFIFFIVKPNSVPITDSIQLDFADMSSDNNGEPLVQEITLNRDSAFFQFTNIDETEYQYVITARFLDWFKLINGKSYRAILAYFDSNHNYHSIIYDWTMDIDSSQQQIITDTTQQNIDKGIQDINGYLNNQDFDEGSIVNNIPSVTINSATDNLLDLLFDSIRTAFTSTTPLNFEFTIPNSNGQKIIIPSDYISSHLPTIIITIIQTFYWYIISRYILKDAWHTIDRMRQGTYYTGADGDIKTEVL